MNPEHCGKHGKLCSLINHYTKPAFVLMVRHALYPPTGCHSPSSFLLRNVRWGESCAIYCPFPCTWNNFGWGDSSKLDIKITDLLDVFIIIECWVITCKYGIEVDCMTCKNVCPFWVREFQICRWIDEGTLCAFRVDCIQFETIQCSSEEKGIKWPNGCCYPRRMGWEEERGKFNSAQPESLVSETRNISGRGDVVMSPRHLCTWLAYYKNNSKLK